MEDAATAGDAARKRKRSAGGCVNAANDVVVEELKKIRARLREPSHLASNYNRAIASIQAHPEELRDGKQAKQLRNIGNYMANQIQVILNKQQRGGGGGGDATSGDSSHSGGPQQKQRRVEQFPPMAAPIASTTSETESRARQYAPSRGKQPWFVLLVLQRAKAWDDDSAMPFDELLVQITRAGFVGSVPKLKACLTTLCATLGVAKRTASGGIFLTVKGQESADLCPGELPGSVSGTTSSSTTGSSSDQSDATSRLSASLALAASGTSSSSNGLAVRASVYDVDDDVALLSEPETIRAASDDEQLESEVEHDYDYGFDPDEEPPTLAERLERRLNPPAAHSHHHISRPVTPRVDPVVPSEHRDGDEWELVLLLDHREILSRRNRSILERKLLERGVTCEVRALNVGDVQWVARRHRPGDDAVTELMLNVIVERKEVHDLSGSIIDRRYFEQKTRLGACGLTHVIYLVEGSLTQQQTTVRASGLQTAMCRTQVQNRFFVQLCRSADESVAFLAGVHARLLAKFPRHACRNHELQSQGESSSLRVSPFLASIQPPGAATRAFDALMCRPVQSFTVFNAQFRKKSQFSVGEMYQMMLMQAPGLSAAKTAALSSSFRTFHELCAALKTRGKQSPLEVVRCGDSQRRLGAKTLKALAVLLHAPDYSDADDARDQN